MPRRYGGRSATRPLRNDLFAPNLSGVKRLAAVAMATSACALVLSGCVQITGQQQAQTGTIGNVVLTTTFCESSGTAACPAGESNSGKGAEQQPGQLLVAYRVPAAALPPAQVVAEYLSPQIGSTALSRSASYSAQLQQKAPAISGEKWVGYISPLVPISDQHQDARFTVRAEFGLGRGPRGEPFAGPFSYRVVGGARWDTADGSEPVDCNSDVTQLQDDSGTTGLQTYCVDTPFGPESVIATDDKTLATRDLGVLNGPHRTVEAGRRKSIPFEIRSLGMNGAPEFALSATTSVPGGRVVASQTVFAPRSSGATVPVSLKVPKGTPPGEYAVALGATLGSQRRTGISAVTVAPPRKPRLTIRVRKRKLGTALKRGLKVRVGCDRACIIKVRLGGHGRGGGRLPSAGKKTVVEVQAQGPQEARAQAVGQVQAARHGDRSEWPEGHQDAPREAEALTPALRPVAGRRP